MSAIPVIEPIIEQAPSVRTLPRRPSPVVIELPRTRAPRARAARVQAQKRTSSAVMSAICFAAVAIITFCSLSLIGQVMVEKARRDGIRAATRARSAANRVAEMRYEIQVLKSPEAIAKWAGINGLLPVDAAPMAKVVPPVASNSH